MSKKIEKVKKTKPVAELSDGAKTALAMLKDEAEGLTIADMKARGFENANASHLTALKRRGLVDSVEVEIEVQVIQKRKVQKYFIKEQNPSE